MVNSKFDCLYIQCFAVGKFGPSHAACLLIKDSGVQGISFTLGIQGLEWRPFVTDLTQRKAGS